MKALAGAFNQEKALASRGLLCDCTTSPINRFAALVGGVGGVGGAAGGVGGGYGGQAPSERTPGAATNDQTLKSLQKHYMNAITSLNPTLPALNVSQVRQY